MSRSEPLIALLEGATERHRAGDLVAARHLYEAVLAANSAQDLALFRLGLLELQEGRAPAAAMRLAQAVERAPGDARYRFGLAQALQSMEHWRDAAQALERAVALAPPDRHRRRLSERLGANGIEGARIRFMDFRPRAEYLRFYHEVDFGLDTVPYNGHTTSLDAFWMGVPIVTRTGDTCVGRAGLSQLYHVDLLDLVADCDEAFVAKGVALGADLDRLGRLRRSLRASMQRSALMDAARFARNIEHAYRSAWLAHCDPSRLSAPLA